MKPAASLCVMCKATKRLCGLDFCPILTKINTRHFVLPKLSTEVAGPSNEVFVGSHGYPFLAIGPLVGIDQIPVPPNLLYKMDYDRIISHRMQFVRGKQFLSVTERARRDIQEIALSTRPVDSEMELTKKPVVASAFSSELQPMGPSAPIKQFRQTENPKIPGKVDSLIEENLLAVDALRELIQNGFDNYYITNIFATGLLGKKNARKLVPTKWSITATHDIIAKQKMQQIREFPQINEITVHRHYSLGNAYTVILMPGSWEFENFESWSPNSIWAKDTKDAITTIEREGYFGRSDYAEKQVGGYYASRYSVVEYLHEQRKQAKVIVMREIDETYIVPIGVFQVQEGVKAALNAPGSRFGSLREVLAWISSKLRTPLKRYVSMSFIINQSRLVDFL